MCQVCNIFLFHLFTFAIILANLAFNLIFYIEYNFENDSIINEINTNLDDKLISSLDFKNYCKDDEEKLILGKWNGTMSGCECEGVIHKEKCTKKKMENDCKQIFANDPINYYVFNSTFICVKRTKLKYREYLKSNQVISNEKECPKNYKSCGILDTIGRKLCVQKEETCPINSITFKNKNLSFIGNENISNGEGIYLTTINLFQYLPCVNFSEKFWNNYYYLEPEDERCKTEINGKLYDERYVKFDNYCVNKLQLYSDNSITNKMTKIDEEVLNKMKNDEIYLFGRNFFGFDDNIIKKYNYDTLISSQNISNNWNFGNFIFNIIIFGCAILAFFLIFVSKLNIKCCEAEKKEIKKLQVFFHYIAGICYLLSNLIILVINSVILHYAIKIKSILDIKSDEILNELLKKLLEDISINFSFSLIIVILTPSLFIFYLIFVSIYVIIRDKFGEKRYEDTYNIHDLFSKEKTRELKKDDDYDDKDED